MTKENRKQFKQEIKNILLKNESIYIFDNIYEDAFGVHIVLKHKSSWQIDYLDISVSIKQVYQYYKEDGTTHDSAVYDVDELKLSLDIINWWYK